MTSTTYRGFAITFARPPVPPSCGVDYHWQHPDYDLDEDRFGDAASVDACKADINGGARPVIGRASTPARFWSKARRSTRSLFSPEKLPAEFFSNTSQ